MAFKIMQCSDAGCPDVFFTSKETGPVFLEVKREGEEPREHQYAFIDKLNKCGTNATWVASWEMWVDTRKKLGLF